MHLCVPSAGQTLATQNVFGLIFTAKEFTALNELEI